MRRFGFSKYGAKKTVVDGITFASKAEARRYTQLKMMEQAGAIKALELQPAYELVVNGQLICKYVADFQYHENRQLVVEDVKGFKTPEYKLKKKLLLALYGIEIRETSK